MERINFEQMVSFSSLLMAWERFRKGKSKRKDVQVFERHLEDNLFALHDDLLSGNYCHGTYHEFHIFDPKHRVIHKATVRDRVVHHLLCSRLEDVFEPAFVADSYSCRNEKGTHAAVRRLQTFVRKVSKNNHESCWALKFDVRKFFDSVDHEILLNIVGKKIENERVIQLVGEVIGSFSVQDRGGERDFLPSKAWASHWKFNITIVCKYIHGCV